MKKSIVALLTVTFAFLFVAALAQGQTGFGGGHAGVSSDKSYQGEGPKDARAEMTGTVVKTPRGLVLDAVEGWYLLEGANLSSMVGKKVLATGEVREYEGIRTFFVTRFAEAK